MPGEIHLCTQRAWTKVSCLTSSVKWNIQYTIVLKGKTSEVLSAALPAAYGTSLVDLPFCLSQSRVELATVFATSEVKVHIWFYFHYLCCPCSPVVLVRMLGSPFVSLA